jgi:hypothetical protein
VDTAALDRFSQQLKGSLRGERSSLLLSLPPPPFGSSAELQPLWRGLVQTFTAGAGAAELVAHHDGRDRYRLSVVQVLPLLTAVAAPLPAAAVHGYERRRRDYGERLARALDRSQTNLPAASGIALQDEARLRQFARLYQANRIVRDPFDALWQVWDGRRWQRLTRVPEQTLADAAAAFVTQSLAVVADGNDGAALPPVGPVAEQPDAGQDDDFGALLDWLLQQPEVAGHPG